LELLSEIFSEGGIQIIALQLKSCQETTGLSAKPLLFLAYINDMPETIIHSEIRLFADDTILFRAINGTINSQLSNKSKSSISFGSYIVHMFVPG
jgi:hypothetical protein